MSIVIDLNIVCLVCLKHEESLCSVFMPDDVNPEMQIAEKISHCSDLKPELGNENLPNKICNNCLNDLRAAWRFRQNCKSAHSVFQNLMEEVYEAEDLPEGDVDIESMENDFDLSCEDITINDNKTASESLLNKSSPELEANHKTYDASPINIIDDMKIVKLKKSDESAGKQNLWFKEDSIDTIQIDNEEVASNQTIDYSQKDEYIEFYMTEERLDDYADGNDIDDIELKEKFKKNICDGAVASTASPVAASECSQYVEEIEDADIISFPVDTQSEQITNQTQISRRTIQTRPMTTKAKSQPDKISTNKTKLQRSQKVEKDDSTYQCSSSDYNSVKNVLKLSRKPPKICEICGNSYRYQHALNAHMRRHNNDRQYSCEFCEKAFISNVELQRHIRVHTGHKPYGCHYCERRFSDFGSRIKHERTHTGERPYGCTTCGKSFAYAHVLSVHLRTHTGEKKFCCDTCGKGFTKKSYLSAHIESHNKVKKGKSLRSNTVGSKKLKEIDEKFPKSPSSSEYPLSEEYMEGEEEYEEEDLENIADIDIIEDDDASILLSPNLIDSDSTTALEP